MTNLAHTTQVRELYSAPDADLLLDIDLDIPAASSIASTSASLLPPCTSSYAQPSQWVAFNTTKHCIANDPIGYSTDTYSHSPFDCTTRWLCFSEAHQCLTQRHRRIVLIGDSYVRETYTDMAKLLTGAKQVWNDTEKQKDAMVEWKGKEGAQTTTTLEYYFAGRLDMLQRRFASGSRRLPSQRWWCLPGMPDVVLFDHGRV